MSRQILVVIVALLILHVVHCRNLLKINKDCECGVPNEELALRIVGGEVVPSNIFPWVVAIFYKGRLFCGGVLINDRYILTAGHCVGSDYLTVGLGLHDIKTTEDGLIISEFDTMLHEKFISIGDYDYNDVGLIRLKSPIAFTNNIRPVCLPAKGSNHTGQEVKVVGWGYVRKDEPKSRYLKHANLKMMSNANCRKTGLGDLIKLDMLCAYADGRDACQGDSGGPLLYQRETEKYETIGIVSWGKGCALKNYPGVYVRLTDYLDWIYSHTVDATYCIDT